MAGYSSRQQFYVDEDTILAEHSNDEFDQLVSAFNSTTGHSHDGTAGEGSLIPLISDGDGDTKVVVEETPDEDKIHMYTTGTKRVTVQDTGLLIGGRFLLSYNAGNDTLDIGVV